MWTSIRSKKPGPFAQLNLQNSVISLFFSNKTYVYSCLGLNLLTETQEDVLANDSNNDGEEIYSDSNNENNKNDKEINH
ncbi:hypothetical protein C2G38_2151589 [Gigaspora rosea]|uniref:Uncharacterized protein n=1 Tax=Gigaspora rosea TaxID=44941 RepID=A0A397W9L3_9GLOM|nr:hypothetical protein C2G38_2151589 [Gigaspora rosea]